MVGDTDINPGKEPRGKLILHDPRFSGYMQVTTGVIDADIDYDHSFLQWNLEMKYFSRVYLAWKRGMIGKEEYFQGLKKPAVNFNVEAWKKMCHLWYYGIDILIQKDNEDRETVAYAPLYNPISELKPHQTLKHIPALKKMNPVGQLKDKTLGIYIRELVNIADAWEGHDLATMVTVGNWIYQFSQGVQPQFSSPEDILNSGGLTYYVSRPYWHAAIDILEQEMTECENEIYLDNHSLMEAEILGFTQKSDDYVEEPERIQTILV